MTRYTILLLACALFLLLYISILTEIAPYLLVRIKFALNLDTSHGEKHSIPFQTLQKLSSLPIVGEFFLQEKRWHNVLAECSQSHELLLLSPLKMLPMRAIAECATLQFLKCQNTIKEMTESAPELLDKIRPLSVLVKLLQKGREESRTRSQALLITQL